MSIDDGFRKIVVVKDTMKPHMDDDGVMFIGLCGFLLDPGSLDLQLRPGCPHAAVSAAFSGPGGSHGMAWGRTFLACKIEGRVRRDGGVRWRPLSETRPRHFRNDLKTRSEFSEMIR